MLVVMQASLTRGVRVFKIHYTGHILWRQRTWMLVTWRKKAFSLLQMIPCHLMLVWCRWLSIHLVSRYHRTLPRCWCQMTLLSMRTWLRRCCPPCLAITTPCTAWENSSLRQRAMWVAWHFIGHPTGAVLGRQNTSFDNLPPNMAASDFLQWNATLLSCSNLCVK